MYCTEDPNTDRMRVVKYVPKYAHCSSIFYGPFVPINTPFLTIQYLDTERFRICGTGVIVELNYSYHIVKKLKLKGEPFKIYKNTAFVKSMFNSQLEISRFEGAKVRTVSGIRGMIKKAAREGVGPPGTFRATFEDKILLSDIVFLRTYY